MQVQTICSFLWATFIFFLLSIKFVCVHNLVIGTLCSGFFHWSLSNTVYSQYFLIN